MDNHIHIISLDVPWPANYGGVIDIFYKLKQLSQLGFKIHLHCFTNGREPQKELSAYCVSVEYYSRKKFGLGPTSTLPYIVQSRVSKRLLDNLKKDDYPILMEGIHCSYPVWEPAFLHRKMLIRLHNTEHIYYQRLAKYESNILRKKYFQTEARRLMQYEKKIAKRVRCLAINPRDADYFKEKLGAKDIQYLPAFTPWNKVKGKPGSSSFCLYHGNLSVNENEQAVKDLVLNIFSKIDVPFVIAGSKPTTKLKKMIAAYSNIQLYADPDEETLHRLIQDAHIHILPSLNATGIKLKLLHALFEGRHCIVNAAAAEGTSLEPLLKIANNDRQMLEMIQSTLAEEFTDLEISKRSELLEKLFNNKNQAKLLSAWLL